MCAMIPMFLVRSRAALAAGEAFDNAAYWRLDDVMVLRVVVSRPTTACCLHSHRVNMPKTPARDVCSNEWSECVD